MTTSRNSKKITFIKNIFFYQVKSSTQKSQKKLRPIWSHLLLLLIIALVIYIFATLRFGKVNQWAAKVFHENWVNFFSFSDQSTKPLPGNLWTKTFDQLWFTIKYTLVGTFIGFILAVITACGTNRTFTNKIWSLFSRNLILLLRSIPEILFIGIFVSTFNPKLSLMLIFIWFSWLWLHKYYIEAIESIDAKPYYVSINQGNSKFKAFMKEILPRLINRFTSLFLYSFEANIRWGAVLSTLGAPGLGVLINYAGKRPDTLSELGIPLLVLLVFVFILEGMNILLNKFVFQINSKKIKTRDYEQLAKHIDWRFWFKIAIISFITIFSIVILIKMEKYTFPASSAKKLFGHLFNPEWNALNWTSNSIKINPILQLLQSLGFTVATLSITLLIAVVVLPLCSLKTNNTFLAYIARMLNSITRIIPTVVVIYLFMPISISTVTLLVFVIGVHESSGFIKQMSEAMDNVDEQTIKNLRLQGYSNHRIYFRFILPTIKYDFLALAVFYFEMAFRNAIIYSSFTNSQDGLYLGMSLSDTLMPRNTHLGISAVYFWLSTLTIFLINIFSEVIVNKWIKKKNNSENDFVYIYKQISRWIKSKQFIKSKTI